jgi:hypothetical protein
LPYRCASAVERIRNDLLLQRILADSGEDAADVLGEAIAETGLARLVVVLRAGDVPFRGGVSWTGRLKV